MWVSFQGLQQEEKILIGRKSFGVMWEGLPAFGLNITLTSSHLDDKFEA